MQTSYEKTRRNMALLLRAMMTGLLLAAGAAVGSPGSNVIERARYTIDVDYRRDNPNMSVTAEAVLPAAAAPRPSLRFELLPSMGTPKVELVSPKSAGALTVREIGEHQDEIRPRATWEIVPAAPFPAGQPISLRFTLAGGSKPSQSFYVGPEMVLASGINQPWYPQFSEEKVVGSLRLHLPAEFRAVATGERGREQVADGRRTIDFKMTWPNRFGFIAGPYQVHETGRKPGERAVTLYLIHDRPYAADLADLARRTIDVLQNEFGPYPFNDYSIAEVPTEIGMKATFGGTGLDGFMMMRSDRMDSLGADPFYFGHEIGHEWWGVSVSADPGSAIDKDGQPPIIYALNEGLAQYGALRVIEAVRGPDAANAFIDSERRLALLLMAGGFDEPLSSLPNGAGYIELSREKGVVAYDQIRRIVGPERMRQFFHSLTSDYRFSAVSWSEFARRLRNAAAPQDRPLVDQWLEQKGFPVLASEWKQEGGHVSLDIEQGPGPAYRLKLPVRLAYRDGTAERRWISIAGPKTNVELPAAKPILSVDLDPARTVPWVTRGELNAALAVRAATATKANWDNGRTAVAKKIIEDDLNARPKPDPTPAEFLDRYFYGWIIEEAGDVRGALEQYKKALELPVRDEEHLAQLYANIARAAFTLGDKDLANSAARSAIVLDEAPGRESKKIRLQVERFLK